MLRHHSPLSDINSAHVTSELEKQIRTVSISTFWVSQKVNILYFGQRPNHDNSIRHKFYMIWRRWFSYIQKINFPCANVLKNNIYCIFLRICPVLFLWIENIMLFIHNQRNCHIFHSQTLLIHPNCSSEFLSVSHAITMLNDFLITLKIIYVGWWKKV